MKESPLPDIASRADIEQLIITFYDRVKADPLLGYIFNEVAKVNWETHTPVIVDFWETILLDNPVYRKNAMEVHYLLHAKQPFTAGHFERWLQLFEQTVHDLYAGPVATMAIKRARGIASLMQFNLKVS